MTATKQQQQHIYSHTHVSVCESTYKLIRALWIKDVTWSFMEGRKERGREGDGGKKEERKKGKRREERKKERKER